MSPEELNVDHLTSRPIRRRPATLRARSSLARPAAALTRREREVLGLLCLRLTDHEIALSLCIGTRTVETHVRNILDKLEARDRREVAAKAWVWLVGP